MNCGILPSEQLIAIRDRLKPFVHGGKHFSSEEIGALVRRINTVVALTEEIEEENRAPSRGMITPQGRSMPDVPVANVTWLRPRLRMISPSDDGGDAA